MSHSSSTVLCYAASSLCASHISKPAGCTFLILPLDVVEEFPEALTQCLLLGFSPNDCADPLCCLVLTQFIILCLKGSKSHNNHEIGIEDDIIGTFSKLA